MTEKERQEIIEFIKAYDGTYDYSSVNFKYYSDEDLLALKKKLDDEKNDGQNNHGNTKGQQP
jgi:hypothetical protein